MPSVSVIDTLQLLASYLDGILADDSVPLRARLEAARRQCDHIASMITEALSWLDKEEA